MTSETIFLNEYGMLVTDREVVVGGVARPLSQIDEVRVESSSAYRGKSIPFLIALLFLLWAVVEVVNAPPSFGWAAFAALLSLLFFGMTRLVGDFQLHTVYLSTANGEVAALQSRDGSAVSALVIALRRALAEAGPQGSTRWLPGRPVQGQWA